MKPLDTLIPTQDQLQWKEIREMLHGVRVGLEKNDGRSKSTDAEILRKRAREFASRNGSKHNGAIENQDVLLFSLGDRMYAASCVVIEEVIPMQNLVALPNTNRAVMGISSNRGVLFTVIDLKRILNIPASELTTMHRVIMLRHDTYCIGLLVDSVHGMSSIDLQSLSELPREMSDQTRRFLRGLTKDRILLVDAEEILREISSLEAVSSDSGKRTTEQRKQV